MQNKQIGPKSSISAKIHRDCFIISKKKYQATETKRRTMSFKSYNEKKLILYLIKVTNIFVTPDLGKTKSKSTH